MLARSYLNAATVVGPLLVCALTLGCGDDPAVGTNGFADADAGDAIGTPDSLDAGDGGLDADTAFDVTAEIDVTTEIDVTSSDGPDASDTADLTGSAGLRTCSGTSLDHTITEDWEHPILTGAIAWQEPGHSIEDVIALWAAPSATVEGKFAYGPFGNDLEDEDVTGFVDICGEWLELGTARTDSDGRVTFEIDTDDVPDWGAAPGRHAVRLAVRMIVEGDGSEANGWLLVVPAETRFVVFDIDGTLTTSDSELLSDFVADLFGGDFVPEAYEGAVDVVSAYTDVGWEVIYLTARPYWLDDITRGWLTDLGFPVGTLHLTRSLSEALPTEGGVGEYKRDYLIEVEAEHELFRAYGNSDTDIFAFREAGIPLDSTFIIGDSAGAEGTVAVDSYPDHLGDVTIPAAEQPWE